MNLTQEAKIFGVVSVAVGMLSITVGTLVVIVLLKAFVLMKLWNWYVAPFFSLPAMDVIHALGISLVVNLLEGMKRSEKKNDTPYLTMFVQLPTFYGIGLLLGWIGTLFL